VCSDKVVEKTIAIAIRCLQPFYPVNTYQLRISLVHGSPKYLLIVLR